MNGRTGTDAVAAPRLVLLSTDYPAYSQSFVRNEIDSLRALGVDVLTVSLNPVDALADGDRDRVRDTWYVKATPPARALSVIGRAAMMHPGAFARVLGSALRMGRADLRQVIRFLFHVVEGVLLWDFCRRRDVRSFHSHFGAPSSVARFAMLFGRGVDGTTDWTCTLTIHGPHDLEAPDVHMLAARVRDAEGAVCVSDYTRSQVQRFVEPAEWPMLEVVRCGVDVAALGALGDSVRAERTAPGDPASRTRVVVPARLAPEKGHLTLLDSLRMLRDEGLQFDVRLIGDGPMGEEIVRRSRELGVDDELTLLGALPHATTLEEIANADVMCLPSYAEGLPVAMMEAMAIGTPVVVTSVAGVPELAVDGVTAVVVAPANPRQLADGLRTALDSGSGDRVERAAAATAQRHDLGENTRQLLALLAGWHGWQAPSEQ